MFESAELGHRISKDVYQEQIPALRESLLDVQFDLQQSRSRRVIVLLAGMDGAGKGSTVNLLNAWMDPRHIETHAFDALDPLLAHTPQFQRYWTHMPQLGRIGIFMGGWYADLIEAQVRGNLHKGEFDRRIQAIINLENMLTRDSTLILKYWLHLSEKEQAQRMELLEHNPDMSWRVTESGRYQRKHYARYRSVAEHCLRLTSSGDNPWVIIEGSDERYRNLTLTRHLHDTIKNGLIAPHANQRIEAAPLLTPVDQRSILDTLKLDQPMTRQEYAKQLASLQGRLNHLLASDVFRKKHNLILVFEGNDAAGKGGSIRRVTQALDARMYRVVPIAAPSEEEKLHPYLWRFWRALPETGHLTLFDRSWYGRVLVERVEHFCTPADWMRAYDEINQFEHQLAESGSIIMKFWLAISEDEQLRRFQEREETGFKRFKITEEDWRNRSKWNDYAQAVNDMVDRTSTQTAPWTLVEANNKYFARIKILETLCRFIEHQLDH